MSLLESVLVVVTFTLIGIFSLFLALMGYTLISGLITVSLITSIIFIIRQDFI